MKRLATILMLCLFVNTYAQQMKEDKKMVKEDKMAMNENMKDKTSIVGVAASNKDFKTLTKAIKAADLVGTFNGDGPFTVFAPTNAAFDKIPQEKLKDLLHPSAKADLTAVLTYHVVPGKITSTDLVAAINDNGGQYIATTVEGTELVFTLDGDAVIITDINGGTSKIIATDVEASNGVIHGIDTVVMPSMTKS